ncbi:hypothetical protein BFV13_003265 [Salmonella enterica subsp. enterica serovar Norwich]|nr:hypothetical protein [Salmonella enterica subsp. enterica serovar Norwich]EDX5251398.1 hypothetical protein [Salmonella enterica subsp. enterica serovar Norwich]
MTRGDWERCRNELEEAAIVLGMVTKGGPQWAFGLPLSQLYRHCRQAEKIIKRQNT